MSARVREIMAKERRNSPAIGGCKFLKTGSTIVLLLIRAAALYCIRSIQGKFL